jgi:hypothetical protein
MSNRKQTGGYLINQIVGFVLVAIFGIIVALLVLEIGLRLIPQAQLDALVERSSQRLALYRLDPRIGWSLKPEGETVITTRDDRSIPIQINSLGLRDTEHPYQKPPGVFRILMLGDSFTEALDVKLEESYPYLVEQCLTDRLNMPVEVINAGVSGYGTPEEYLFYINEGVKYQPDLVVWMLYTGNDFTDLFRNLETRLVAGFGGYQFRLDAGKLEKTWVSWAYPHNENVTWPELLLRRYSRVWRVLAYPESKIYWAYRDWRAGLDKSGEATAAEQPLDWRYYMHTANFSESEDVPPEVRQAWKLFWAVVDELHARVIGNDQQLVSVIIPADYQVNGWAREQLVETVLTPDLGAEAAALNWDATEPNRSLVQLLESQNVPVLDLQPYFQGHDDAGGASLYFKNLGEHLNRDGQKLTADVMCEWLIQNKAVVLPTRQ